MNRVLLVRYASMVVMLWVIGGVVAWIFLDPADHLVGAKAGWRENGVLYDFSPPDLQERAAALSKVVIWGLQRNGMPRQKKSPEKEGRSVEWRVLAVTVRDTQRHLVILVDKTKLEHVAEGATLPDGSLLKHVSLGAYTVQTLDDEQITTHLTFQ